MDVVRCVHYFFSRKGAKERRDFFNHRFRRLTQFLYLHVLQAICTDIFRI